MFGQGEENRHIYNVTDGPYLICRQHLNLDNVKWSIAVDRIADDKALTFNLNNIRWGQHAYENMDGICKQCADWYDSSD